MQSQLKKPLKNLLEEARGGSEEAFRVVFEHLSDKIFFYALSRTSSRDDAFDIVQETFIELWRALGRFEWRSEEQFYGFIFTITKRRLINSRKKRPTLPLNEDMIKDSYSLEIKDFRLLERAIDALGGKYRELLELRYWSDLTFAEIAAILNISVSAAKVRHHRAINKLQVLLAEHEQIL